MRVALKEHTCEVGWEPGDPKLYNDSRLLYQVKRQLQKQGFDVVKKLMWHDGHLVDDHQHYLRERRWKFCVYWDQWAIRNACEDYNKGEVELCVERWSK